MLTYIVLIILSVMLAYALRKKRLYIGLPKKSNYNDCIMALLLSIPSFIVSVFRDSAVGVDYYAYTVEHYALDDLPNAGSTELIGILIIKIARLLKSPIFIIVLYSALTSYLIFLWVKQNSNDLVLSVSLIFLSGLYNWTFNIMRQSLATIVFFLALKYIQKEKIDKSDKVRFVICLIVAILIHRTTIIYIIFLFFPYELFVKRFNVFLLALPVAFFSSGLIRSLIMWVSKKLNIYYQYFNAYYDQAEYTGSLIFICVVILLLVIVTYKKWSKKGKEYVVYAAIIYTASFFSLVANVIPNNARVTFLFYPICVVAVPKFLYLIKKKKRRIVLAVVIASMIVFYTNSIVMKNWGGTVPYIWNSALFR